MTSSTKSISETLGSHIGTVEDLHPLHGGDINQVFSFKHQDKQYCVKVNDANQFPQMFQTEAKGLDQLRQHSRFTVPGVIDQFDKNGMSFLVLEFIHGGQKDQNYAESFAQKLCDLHDTESPQFGLDYDNYIGSLVQYNTTCNSWSEFYGEMRLNKLARICFDQGLLSLHHLEHLSRLCRELDNIFPKEKPSLLHGDLWGGNAMAAVNGPCIYDPAVYFGHREMDLGMMCLFGGFEADIFNIYQEISPLESDWEKRVPLTQLYPLFVHLILLGNSYLRPIDKTLKQF